MTINRKPWTRQEIELLQKASIDYTTHEITQLLPNRNYNSVRIKLARLKITTRKYNKPYFLKDLSNFNKQLILGSLAGDGCVRYLSNSSKHCLFEEGHKEKECDYCRWKFEHFRQIFGGSGRYISCKNETKGNPEEPMWVFTTCQHPIFTHLRKSMYEDKFISGKIQKIQKHKHYLPLDIYKNLDLLGLLIWYLDDGSLRKGNNTASIGVSGWETESLNKIISNINDRFDLQICLKIYKNNKEMRIPAKDRDFLFTIWNKNFLKYKIPSCMLHKTTLPKNIKKYSYWTIKEIDELLINIDSPIEKLKYLLPNRTINSIKNKITQLKIDINSTKKGIK